MSEIENDLFRFDITEFDTVDDIKKLSARDLADLLGACLWIIEDLDLGVGMETYEHAQKLVDIIDRFNMEKGFDPDAQLRKIEKLIHSSLSIDPDDAVVFRNELKLLFDEVIYTLAEVDDIKIGEHIRDRLEEHHPEVTDISPFELEWLAIYQYPNSKNIRQEDIEVVEQALGRKLTNDDFRRVKTIQKAITKKIKT